MLLKHALYVANDGMQAVLFDKCPVARHLDHAAIAAFAMSTGGSLCTTVGKYSLFELTSMRSYNDWLLYSSILDMLKVYVDSDGSFQKSSLSAVPLKGL
jgi:hypothetical protein